jgi:hydrogenase expression/formation protein HypC
VKHKAKCDILFTSYEERIMCLAIPARIVELEGDNAVVDAMGNRWRAKTTLLPEAKLGNLVLIHAGFAISLVDEEEAKKTWQLIAEINDFNETSNKVSG